MTLSTVSNPRAPSKGKKFFFAGLVIVFSLVLAAGIAEVLLRIIPIPGITFHSYYYDDLTGGRSHPNTTVMYRNERGDHHRRKVNSWGFLDRNHELAKGPGVVRIGFFGDSFTEAAQVPLEQTFVRLSEDNLNILSRSISRSGMSSATRARHSIERFSTSRPTRWC